MVASDRIYKAGRLTDGWRKGLRVESLAALNVGDVLIHVSHQFRTENLIRVIERPADYPARLFYYRYVRPNGKPADGGEMAAYDWDLQAFDTHEFFRAVRECPTARKN